MNVRVADPAQVGSSRSSPQEEESAIIQPALDGGINWFGTVVTIPSTTNVRQAEQNAGALHFRFSDDDLASLDEQSRAFR
ncbi:MAG: hypothetical protein M1482_09415 [Chloroflexi bacterium]|nr:hypothetical protein [Chloroflexota bacterium]